MEGARTKEGGEARRIGQNERAAGARGKINRGMGESAGSASVWANEKGGRRKCGAWNQRRRATPAGRR